MTRRGPAAAAWAVSASAVAALMLALAAGCSSAPPPPPQDREQLPTAAPSEPPDPERRWTVRFELANAYYAQGQFATALEEVKRALAINPIFGPAYNLRGLIYGSLGDEAQADESFRRALQINPRDADAMHNYGWFLCQRQRMPEAVAQFNQALTQPQYRDAARTLAAPPAAARVGPPPGGRRGRGPRPPTPGGRGPPLADALVRARSFQRGHRAEPQRRPAAPR